MDTIVAPSLLIALCMGFIATMTGARSAARTVSGAGLFLFAATAAVLIAGAAFMTNWLAFIDPPDYCWKARDEFKREHLHDLAWDDCRLQITITALSLDAVIAGAMTMFAITARRP